MEEVPLPEVTLLRPESQEGDGKVSRCSQPPSLSSPCQAPATRERPEADPSLSSDGTWRVKLPGCIAWTLRTLRDNKENDYYYFKSLTFEGCYTAACNQNGGFVSWDTVINIILYIVFGSFPAALVAKNSLLPFRRPKRRGFNLRIRKIP